MKKRKVFTIGLLLPALAFLTACSEDSDSSEYRSEPPVFLNMSIENLSDGSDEVHVGDTFVITGEQDKKGRLIYKAEYGWENSLSFSQTYTSTVIYDNNNVNPTDTLVATSAGSNTVTFTGKYYASGNTSVWSSKYGSSCTIEFEDGSGEGTYTVGGILYFTVVLEKTFTIYE